MRLFFVIIFYISGHATFGQSFSHTQQYWMGYMTQGKISDQWSIWNDTHWVPDSFFLLRTGGTYHFKSKYRINATAGFAKLWIYPSQPNLNTFRPENRPWGQVMKQYKPNQRKHTQRIRIDARFRRNIQDDELLEGYDFNWRFRYMYQIRYDFNPNANTNYFFTTLSNEILYNYGSNINQYLRLDQNRLQLAVGYQRQNMAFQLGYMNFTTKQNANDVYTMKHTLTAWVFHQFDFR